MAFKKIAVEDLMMNPFTKMGKEWMLITAGNETTGINTMTAVDPMKCVAIGTGKFVEFLSGHKDEEP